MTDSIRVFELRTYKAHPGKLAALEDRFRNHTIGFFHKHGMEVYGFFNPIDEPDTLTYLVGFESAEAREKAWVAFRSDPDWLKVRSDTETDGEIVEAIVEARVMTPTEFSTVR